MIEKQYNKINKKVMTFFEQLMQEEKIDEIDYIITVNNTPSAVQKIILIKNKYKFLEEQMADQITNEENKIYVDFNINLKDGDAE